MKEQEISFQTSKLAKECGFEETAKSYNEMGKAVTVSLAFRKHKPQNIYYPRVTQGLLQKWLREIHNIDVEVHNSKGIDDNKIYLYSIDSIQCQTEYDTYELALEDGLIKGM